MKISTRGRYALRIILDIAMHQDHGFAAMKDIARRQQISKKIWRSDRDAVKSGRPASGCPRPSGWV